MFNDVSICGCVCDEQTLLVLALCQPQCRNDVQKHSTLVMTIRSLHLQVLYLHNCQLRI